MTIRGDAAGWRAGREAGLLEQIVGAAFAVVIALAAAVAYFWGTNWLLDKFLATDMRMSSARMTQRDTLRTKIRPWLFLLPALLFLSVYLIYPVFETLRKSSAGR